MNANIPAEHGAPDPRGEAPQSTIEAQPTSFMLSLIRPNCGGFAVARLTDNTLAVTYSGPPPFGREVAELFAVVDQYLTAARRLRLVDRLTFEASFEDCFDVEADCGDSDDDEGESERARQSEAAQ